MLRISGPDAYHVFTQLGGKKQLVPRHATLTNLRHPTSSDILDREPVIELHLHGGPAVVRDVLQSLTELRDIPSLRPALPGEFTRRAFEHGRMDLNSCEALDTLLRAETSTQRRLAISAGHGQQAAMYTGLREQLLDAMVRIEAMLDFSDEDGIDASLWDHACATVQAMRSRLQKALPDAAGKRRQFQEVVMDGAHLALYGKPNAGKSSLLNRLTRRDAAIVSSEPGTTRDIVEVAVELDGYRVFIADTAGVRRGGGPIERLGMDRTRVLKALGALQEAARDDMPYFIYLNKMDTLGDAPRHSDRQGELCYVWSGSVYDDQGIDKMLEDIGARLAALYDNDASETPLVTQVRHAHLLQSVLSSLDTFAAHHINTGNPDITLAAEELRYAANLFGQLTGETLSSDEILGAIFARFCIGK
ncbi:Mss1p [Malassezia vespertilionis]|uniref:Mss1p n=1 Tax=Malassezia vespertilionis TaxID=2020962 RepID=A0A2N1JEM7_9BASI|nr:Mss1p [Malassezia vespertilionis]